MKAVAAGEDPLAPDNRLKRVCHSLLFSRKGSARAKAKTPAGKRRQNLEVRKSGKE
jgi:hypothetical protein